MKIVHAASELYPYVKTGGLADAVGSLSATLADHGHEVSVFLPGYRSVLEHKEAAKAELVMPLKIEMGDETLSGEVKVFSPRVNLKVYMICRDEFFDRKFPYGNGTRDYEDNGDRYIFFCKGVVETLRLMGGHADIVHGHDWQAALLPVLVRQAERRHRVNLALKTVFTIHNIAFQGIFPMAEYARTNLPDELKGIDGLEYYGQMSFMKGGILFSDRVTTVSPRYAQEIQTPDFGCGLDGVVATRAEDLLGLLNGVDSRVWSPSADEFIPARYSAGNLAGKAVCRAELLKKCGLKASEAAPVFGMVCRLTEQKGVQLLLANRNFFLERDCRLIVLGSGDPRLEQGVRDLAAAAPDRIALAARLDEPMSHLVEAGSDFFLMPSMFEPCGLNQMYSQAYGTVPLVTRVGGLVDTVVDCDVDPENGTGITFPPTVAGVAAGLERAMALAAQPARYRAVQANAMARDFSWGAAVAAYERLYEESI